MMDPSNSYNRNNGMNEETTSAATSTILSSTNNNPSGEDTEQQQRQQLRNDRRKQRRTEKGRTQRKRLKTITTLIFHPLFILLFALLVLALGISFFLVLNHPDGFGSENDSNTGGNNGNSINENIQHRLTNEDLAVLTAKLAKDSKLPQEQQQPLNQGQALHGHQPKLTPDYTPQEFDKTEAYPHLVPFAPPLPIFYDPPNAEQLIDNLLHKNKPTMAGIIAFFNQYLRQLHSIHKQNSRTNKLSEMQIITQYFDLTKTTLAPFEDAYRGRTIFPIREEEGSIFVSLAAFREHLLAPTLQSAFEQAEHPEKIYIGAVIQNCFGLQGTTCRTGLQVIGKDAEGRDQTKMSDAPPDKNGIEVFCNMEDGKYKHYCENGQLRAIYVHDTDALGPATARYYASKLWGGETYFMQMDSHLEFAQHWDTKYKEEVHLAKNYPKAVLSAYPPGFTDFSGEFKGGSPGARLCMCEFSSNGVENHIIRINTNGKTPPDAKAPTQIAFIAAGFFFAHASFLKDVPFDPYVPWCFMGEEIALSIRAWTNGWNIYAPRKNLIAHQYRPGRLGLPKFWESVGRDSGRPQLNTKLQKHVIRRIKHMVGYTTDTPELIQQDGDGIVLTDYEHYSLGRERTLQEYLELTNIDVVNQKCKWMGWCAKGTLE